MSRGEGRRAKSVEGLNVEVSGVRYAVSSDECQGRRDFLPSTLDPRLLGIISRKRAESAPRKKAKGAI